MQVANLSTKLGDVVAFKETCDGPYIYGVVDGLHHACHWMLINILHVFPSSYPLEPPRFGTPSGKLVKCTWDCDKRVLRTPYGTNVMFYMCAKVGYFD